jgi:hypothetical protein
MLDNRKEMDKEDLIKYCIFDCIKDNYIGKPEEDIELLVAQTLFNEMGQKGGLGILVDWSTKYYSSNYELAKHLMDSLTKQKGKDKLTIDVLVNLARPFDEDNKLKNLITDEDDYAEKKIEFEEAHFQAADVFYQIYDNSLRQFNKSQFTVKYEHMTYGKDQENFIKRWFLDRDKKLYESVDFLPPPLEVSDDVFNIWDLNNGDLAEQSDDSMDTSEEVSTDIIHDFFRKLTNSDEEGYDYLIKLAANLLQHPATKPEVGVFFTSAPGSGKDTFYKLLILLLCDGLVSIDSEPDNVFGKYNIDSRLNKLVIILQEAENLRSYSGKIKDMITCKTAKLANKGTKQITVKDFTRLYVFSNNDNILKIEPDDRRWVIFNCFNFFVDKDPTFFKKLHTALDNPEVIKKFRKELMDYNISKDFNFQLNRPKTDKFNDLKKVNTPSIIKWVYYFSNHVDFIDGEGNDTYKSKHLCDMYNEYCKLNYETSREINVVSFGIQLKKYFYINNIWRGFEHTHTRTGNVFIIDKQALNSVITDIYGYSEII